MHSRKAIGHGLHASRATTLTTVAPPSSAFVQKFEQGLEPRVEAFGLGNVSDPFEFDEPRARDGRLRLPTKFRLTSECFRHFG